MHIDRELGAAVVAVLAGVAVSASPSTALGQSRDPHATSCASMARELHDWVSADPDRVLAYHLTMAKSRGGSGHISVVEGHLVPRPRAGAARALADLAQYGYVMESLTGSSSRPREFPTARRDEVDVWLLDSGEIDLVLRSWGDTELSLVDRTCREDRFGYYATGFMEEGNGTRTVALAIRQKSD